MKKTHSIVMGISAMMCLLISLPMTWLTLHHARREFDIGTITVTGLNGSITLWVSCPVWAIVLICLFGVVFAFLNRLQLTSLPNSVCLGPLLISSLYICQAFLVALSRNGRFGMGLFFAALGLVMGYCLAFSNSRRRTMDDLMHETLYGDSDHPAN